MVGIDLSAAANIWDKTVVESPPLLMHLLQSITRLFSMYIAIFFDSGDMDIAAATVDSFP
jgi:hypothetical protein